MKRIRLYHFHNSSGGGVLSVIRNLLYYRQHDEIENHVIYTINKERQPQFDVPGLTGAASERIFYYSPKWNFYYTVKQLAKLLPDEKAVIVAHDWLELGMVSNLGLNNPLVQFVHGAYDYYYNLAVRHNSWVDRYIVVAASIKEELRLRLPEREADIRYLRFPVPDISCSYVLKSEFQLVFAGRCEEAKGYLLLPKIELCLRDRGIRVKWHIAGQDSLDASLQQIWPDGSDVVFYGELLPNSLMKLLCAADVFILPSLAEGMPVSVIEAMKALVVPLVNDLPGGLQELVINDITGYRVSGNKPEKYADIIGQLVNNHQKLNELADSARSLALEMFDPKGNAELIENYIMDVACTTRKKSDQKVYGSRMDEKWIPNFVTEFFR